MWYGTMFSRPFRSPGVEWSNEYKLGNYMTLPRLGNQ